MRSLGIAIAVLLGGCKVLNPAFGDDGSGTSNDEGSASDTSESGPPMSTTTGSTGSTGQPGTAADTGPMSATSMGGVSSGTDTMSSSSETDVQPSEPVRVPITFVPRMEPLVDFVARVRIEEPHLTGFTRSHIAFTRSGKDTQVPFEIVEYDPVAGRLDAWVLLQTWSAEDQPTVIDLVVGNEANEPPSPWDTYEHVWHLDEEDVMVDATQNAQGQFLGYGETPGTDEGVVGQARHFDGEDDRAEVPSVAAPSTTVAAYGWVRVDDLPLTAAPFFGRNDGPPGDADPGANGVDWAVNVDGNGITRMVLRVGSGTAMTSSGVPIGAPTDDWHHYGVVSSGEVGQTRYYVDGVASQILTTSIPTGIAASSISMAAWHGEKPSPGNTQFEGAIDEFVVLHREVSLTWMQTVVVNQRTPEDTYDLGEPQPL